MQVRRKGRGRSLKTAYPQGGLVREVGVSFWRREQTRSHRSQQAWIASPRRSRTLLWGAEK